MLDSTMQRYSKIWKPTIELNAHCQTITISIPVKRLDHQSITYDVPDKSKPNTIYNGQLSQENSSLSKITALLLNESHAPKEENLENKKTFKKKRHTYTTSLYLFT